MGNRVNILDHFIEISGIPEMKEECCVITVEKIAAKLGVKSMVTNAFHVHSKIVNNPRKIIVVMSDMQSKKSIIISSRQLKPKGKMIQADWEDNSCKSLFNSF